MKRIRKRNNSVLQERNNKWRVSDMKNQDQKNKNQKFSLKEKAKNR